MLLLLILCISRAYCPIKCGLVRVSDPNFFENLVLLCKRDGGFRREFIGYQVVVTRNGIKFVGEAV